MVDIRCSNVLSSRALGCKWERVERPHGRIDEPDGCRRARLGRPRQEEPDHDARGSPGPGDRAHVLRRAHPRRCLPPRHRRGLERRPRRAPRRARRARDRLHDLPLRAEVRGCRRGLRVPHARRPPVDRRLHGRLLLRRRALPRRRRHLPRARRAQRQLLEGAHLAQRARLVDLGDDRARDRARPQLPGRPPRDPRHAHARRGLVPPDVDPRVRDHREGRREREHPDDVRPRPDVAVRRSPAAVSSVGSCSASSSSSASRRRPRSARSPRIPTARSPAR